MDFNSYGLQILGDRSYNTFTMIPIDRSKHRDES